MKNALSILRANVKNKIYYKDKKLITQSGKNEYVKL